MKADATPANTDITREIRVSSPTVPCPPSSSRIAPPRHSIWTTMFRMVVIEWVNDFLFNTPGTTHASMLLSPTQETNAQLMSSSVSYLNSIPSIDIHSHWVLLPVYSVAGTSVGLVVQEENSAGAIPRLTRYVRCDDTGETLCITDSVDSELEVEYVRYDDTFTSIRMFCTFDATLVPHLRTRNICDAIVKASLLHSMTLQETRASCGQCDSKMDKCQCKLGFRFRRARHPLDFPHTAMNTLPLLGDFRGVGSSMNFRPGRIFEHMPVATELRTRTGGKIGTTQRLQIWAARFCFEQAKPNPLMLEMPPVGSTDATDEMINGFLCDDGDAAAGEKKDSLKVAIPTKVKKEEEGRLVGDMDNCTPVWKIPVPLSTAKPDAMIDIKVATPTNITPTTLLPAPAPVAIAPLQGTPVPVQLPMMKVSPAPVQAQNNTSVLPMPLLPLPVLPNSNIPQKRRWTSIAPSAAPTENIEQYTSAERRKILKREAAARSNAKRKELVALQRRLAKAKAKVEILRKREEQLRDENRELLSLRETKVG